MAYCNTFQLSNVKSTMGENKRENLNALEFKFGKQKLND
jgi:hypothetical protein